VSARFASVRRHFHAGRFAEAEMLLRQILCLDPGNADGLNDFGNVLLLRECLNEAFASFDRAVVVKPDCVGALGLNCYFRRKSCAWDRLVTDEGEVLELLRQGKGGLTPFAILGMASTPADQLICASMWAQEAAVPPDVQFRHGPATLKSATRFRLGYLSADFRAHATAYLAAELFERHDRSRFEVTGYSLGKDDGSATHRRLVAAFDRFVDLSTLSDEVAARRIHDDGIDILVDLKGYTQGARPQILAWRPAPLQVSFLGYPSTMGAAFVDAVIADAFVLPFDQQPFYHERIFHLPDCYQPNDSKRAIAAETPSRAACGLPDRDFVFCCFNNSWKITPEIFGVWMRLLAVVPGSVLWLLETNDVVRVNLRKEAAVRGIVPDRLVFAPRLPPAEHLARHRLADLFLDTLPYNAHTTASDALWAGLPVLTCVGSTFAGRVAGSLLKAIGLPELITASLADYEALALRLVSEPGLLAGLRRRLAENRPTAPLFDSDRFTRNLEAAYAQIWQSLRQPVHLTLEQKVNAAAGHHRAGHLAEAEAAYREILAAEQGNAEVYCNLGTVLRERSKVNDAIDAYRRSIVLHPGLAETYYNLGNAFVALGQLVAAVRIYRLAVTIKPDFIGPLSALAHWGRHLCDWVGLQHNEAATLDLVRRRAGRIPPFAVLGMSSTAVDQLLCARLEAERVTVPAEARFRHTEEMRSGTRLRIGYLSGDFRDNLVAYRTVEMFERHDRARFEVIGYSYGPDDNSDIRRRVAAAFDRFVDLSAMSDAEAARCIHNDCVDILVDLTGYLRDCRPRILAFRPAPAQVNFLGYPGTMGADFIDYIIADAFVLPIAQQKFCREKIVHLPDCYLPGDTQRLLAEDMPSRTACGLPERSFVFCCFNSSWKIGPAMFDIWMRLLAAVPGSVLWLAEGGALAKANLGREAQARGIDPERLVFAPRLPMALHLARHRLAGLFLDTLPFNGHTTASDALWAGLPVLTCVGDTFAGRVAGSLLKAVGLPELITSSLADYEALALRLATEPGLLACLRERLAVNRPTAPLFDSECFTRNIENLYRRIWQERLDRMNSAETQPQDAAPRFPLPKAGVSPLWDLLQPRRLTHVVDVGANPIDGEPPYKAMLSACLCRVTGFEPQPEAFARLLQPKGPLERYLPYAIGDGGSHSLQICVAPGMTSLLEPDCARLEMFDVLKGLTEIKERVLVQTRRLDDLPEVQPLDFLKIDVQGSELAVFDAAENCLAEAVAVQTEVSFVTLYKNQPTFGDVDSALRRLGFIPHCFASIKKWPIAPFSKNDDPRLPLNQLLEADIVYVRDFSRPDLLSDEQLKHLALIAHHCYGSFDLTLRCITLLEGRNALRPGSCDAYLAESAKPRETSIDQAPTVLEPRFAAATALHRDGHLAEAESLYRQVLTSQPDHARSLNNLGLILHRRGLPGLAMLVIGWAVAVDAGYADAHFNLGTLHKEREENGLAIAAYRTAIALKPDYSDACSNLGVALKDKGHYTEAVAAFRHTVVAQPESAAAYHNLAGALSLLDRLTEAAGLYGRACLVLPDFPAARISFCQVRQRLCDWDDLEAEESQVLALVRRREERVPPFFILAMPSTPDDQLLCGRLWTKELKGEPQLSHAPERRNGGDGRRLRIGYLSADLHHHATTCLAAELFEKHDRARFETFAFSYGPDDASPMRRRLIAAFNHFIDLRDLPDAAAARRIHEEGIDILVDLKGYTRNARTTILAFRPAPLQVSFLGYPGTMGAHFIDYIIADAFVLPPDQQPFYDEKIVRLPDCYQPNDRQRPIADHTPSRADCGLPASGFVFCCFNNSYKITPSMFDLWMRLLGAVDGSVLWLLDTAAAVRDNLRKEAARRGIAPDRLVFAPRLPLPEHLARHRLADLFLDTLPYNAHTTASDALWVGLPVLTCVGETFAGRVAGSLLTAIGLPELITRSLADYEALAVRLARQPKRLARLRRRLAANRLTAPLFDSDRFARNIEAAYDRMWEERQFNAAARHHAAGRLAEAVNLYQDILGRQPRHAAVHCNLGNLLREQGRIADAAAAYRRAIALLPGFPEACSNLGVAHMEQGQVAGAIEAYQRAVLLRPAYAEAHSNFGNALARQGKFAEAEAAYRQAFTLEPDYAEAHANLAEVFAQQGSRDHAASAFRQALALNPGFAGAYTKLGNMMRRQGGLEQAIALSRRATILKPNVADFHLKLGNALSERESVDDAVSAYQRTIILLPNIQEAYHNVGSMLSMRGKIDQAIPFYARAVVLKPDFPGSLHELCHRRRQLCDWQGVPGDEAKVLALVRQTSERIATFNVLGMSSTPADQLLCARLWAEGVGGPGKSRLCHLVPPGNRERLRIGYLSVDLRHNLVAYLAAEIFERHDHRRFEVIGYSYGPDDGSEIRRRLIAACDRFVDVSAMPHAEAAGRIHDDGVDILVDLTGYLRSARPQIAAWRPAPLQVNFLGYPGTMGADFIDYIIADPFVLPFDQHPFCSEKIVHLPGCYLPSDSRRPIAEETPSRRPCGLPEQGFVFCCFNTLWKLTPAMFDVWMRLLTAVPGSALWLPDGGAPVRANLEREARARGIDPGQLVFAPRLPLAQHLARQRLADLFLDTLPFNGHTTASDALWAGLPVLTCAGQTFAGRVAGSLLKTIGLPELITSDLAEYEALAVRLATEPSLLGGLRRKLAECRQTSPYFDGEQFTRNLEAAYEKMWKIRQAGKEPSAFAVGRDDAP
jgi:FkbM family methyltransferase